MQLNTIKPAAGSHRGRKRVGRGGGRGKTCGRGHKGQKSRAGSNAHVGFEGGQMPVQRRLPKVGFRSRKSLRAGQVPSGALRALAGDTLDLAALKAAGLLRRGAATAKVFYRGGIDKPLTVKGVQVSKGARAAIEAAGGKIED